MPNNVLTEIKKIMIVNVYTIFVRFTSSETTFTLLENAIRIFCDLTKTMLMLMTYKTLKESSLNVHL